MIRAACRVWRCGKLIDVSIAVQRQSIDIHRYANAAINIVTDCMTALLPVGVINSLDMPRRQKNLLLGVFGIGLMYVLAADGYRHICFQTLTPPSTCFISILRLVYIYPMAVNPDQTWHSPLLCIWSAVEMNVAILCSCAPTLRCLVQRFWPKFLDSLASSARRSTRDDSAATAVGSTSSLSKTSYDKSVDVARVEEQPAVGMLSFRRSLFKPFSGGAVLSLATCYGGKPDLEEMGAQKKDDVELGNGVKPEGITKTTELEMH